MRLCMYMIVQVLLVLVLRYMQRFIQHFGRNTPVFRDKNRLVYVPGEVSSAAHAFLSSMEFSALSSRGGRAEFDTAVLISALLLPDPTSQ